MNIHSTYHVIPSCYYRFHIEVTGKECHNSIGYNLAVFDEDATKVTNDGWVVPDFEPRADCDLVTSTSDDLLISGMCLERKNGHTSGRKQLRVSVIGYDS